MNGLNRKAEDRLQGTSNGPGGTGFIPSAPGKARNQRDDAGAGGRRGAERANTEGSPGTAGGGAAGPSGDTARARSAGTRRNGGGERKGPASIQEQSRESGAGSTGWEARSQAAAELAAGPSGPSPRRAAWPSSYCAARPRPSHLRLAFRAAGAMARKPGTESGATTHSATICAASKNWLMSGDGRRWGTRKTPGLRRSRPSARRRLGEPRCEAAAPARRPRGKCRDA